MMPGPPTRPDLRADGSPIGAASASGPSVATLPDGRPKVTWRFLPTLGVVLLGFVLGSLAAAPLFAALGDTSEGGASGVSEIAQGIVVDVVMAGIAAAIVIAILAAVTNEEVAVPEQVTGDLRGFELVVFAVFAVVVAPITEEFLFRGLIYRSIRDRHGVALGAIVSALLFGVIHYVPGPWPDAVALQITMVVTGLGLALVYEWRTTLLSPIVGHAAFNLIAVAVIVSDALR